MVIVQLKAAASSASSGENREIEEDVRSMAWDARWTHD